MPSCLSVAPTVITLRAQAGEPTVLPPGPELPAATQTTMPSATALSHATEIASVPSFTLPPPSDKLITFTFWSRQYSRPAITSLIRPPPLAFNTLAITYSHSYATPRYLLPL